MENERKNTQPIPYWQRETPVRLLTNTNTIEYFGKAGVLRVIRPITINGVVTEKWCLFNLLSLKDLEPADQGVARHIFGEILDRWLVPSAQNMAVDHESL